jgi:hypothetical protein
MKNNFKILAVIISMIITGAANAQYSIKKNKISDGQQLIKVGYFETKQVSDKQIKRSKRNDVIEKLKERYQKENIFLSNLISDNWNSSDKPKEISTSELNAKIKNKEDIWYITLKKHSDKFFDRRVVKKNYYFDYSHYQISLCYDKTEVLRIPLVDEELSLLNAEFAIQQIQNFIKDPKDYKNQRQYVKEVNASAGALSNKTLLISQKLTGYSEEYLKSFYKGSIKIVSEQEIIEAVKRKDKSKAYLLITINDYSDEPSFNHLIIDCESNEPILIYRNSTAYSKPCEHLCIVHHHNSKLEYLFGFHFRKYRKMIKS